MGSHPSRDAAVLFSVQRILFPSRTSLTRTNILWGKHWAPVFFAKPKKSNSFSLFGIAGAFGKVSLVEHKATGMIRALKAIKKTQAQQSKQFQMLNEAKILMKLDHPNIVKLFELFQDSKFYYMVTEHCTGGELFDRIHQKKFLSEELASIYMKQVFSAIYYCHKKQIAHRDLKPENILLESKEENSAVKLIDFGLAAEVSNGKKLEKVVGTVRLPSFCSSCDRVTT